jgi:prepilin peptidase CpaA
MDEWIRYFLAVLLVLSTWSDVLSKKIPNVLTMPFSACAIILHSYTEGMDGFLFSTAGMAVGIGLLIVPYILSGMGAGDVKLMGAVGAFLGAKATLEAFIFIALAGGVYSLALILFRRDAFKGFFGEKLMVLSSMVMLRQYVPLQTQTESSGQKPRLKYGVAIAFGTIAYLLLNSFGIKFFA